MNNQASNLQAAYTTHLIHEYDELYADYTNAYLADLRAEINNVYENFIELGSVDPFDKLDRELELDDEARMRYMNQPERRDY